MPASTFESGGAAGSLHIPDAASVSLEGIHAPAAFVDRNAHILHANSSFYTLVRTAELAESQWVDAFERPETLRALIETIDNDHALSVANMHRADGVLAIWLAVSANAQPMPGRRDTIRLVSLHCGSEAVRLQLSLRAGDVIAEDMCAHALDRHLTLLTQHRAQAPQAGRAPGSTRDVLAAQAPPQGG
jgi:hypothetical protein